MDDLKDGTRDKRGDWRPNEALQTAPLFVFPPQPIALLKWLPSYFLPWNAAIMGITALVWYALTPDMETLRTLEADWIAYLLVRNSLGILMFYGLFQWHFYIKRRQGNLYKYNGKWPEAKNGSAMFGGQMRENLFLTFGCGVPVMTAYEVLMLWVFANGYVPWLSFADNPIWLLGFALVIPILHEVHFYLVHRLIHQPVLYKHIHTVHHNSVNPSPFSSLSMHPVEHVLYFSGVLIHFVVPSNPLLAMYHLSFAGYGAVVGHIGFDKWVEGDTAMMDTHAFSHYLHHKYFEVNYGDGTVPLDRLFGTHHDGTKVGDAVMQARFERKRARMGMGKSGPR